MSLFTETRMYFLNAKYFKSLQFSWTKFFGIKDASRHAGGWAKSEPSCQERRADRKVERQARRAGYARMAVLMLLCFFMTACNSLPPSPSAGQQIISAQSLADQLAAARSATSDLKAAVAATTQPVIVTPATATQPAVTIPTPPEVAKAAQKADSALSKVDQGLATAQTIVNAATQPGANPGTAVVAAAPLAGPYAPWVALGGIVLSALWGLRQKQVLTSTVAGVRDALNDGTLIATTGASQTVDSAVLDHPSTNELVDAVLAKEKPNPFAATLPMH